VSEGPAGKMARKPSSPNAKYTFAVDPAKRALVGKKTRQARRKISGGPAESAEQATRVRFRDSRFLVYFALDSRRKSFRRRQNNATFLAIESEATSTRAGVLCGVSRRSRTMSLTNVTEDLSGLSRAELVYKAKLAEQAERCVRPLLVSISAFPPSRVACGRRTEENLSVWRAGPYILRSDLGSGEPSAPPRSHGTTRVSFASPSPAAPRIEPRARLAGPDLARDHTVSSRIARIVNSNRDTSSSAAHGDDAGALARGRRARYPRSRSRHSHEAALSPAEARHPPPRRSSTPRGGAPSRPRSTGHTAISQRA
jgi:hypothetical protein